MSTCSVFKNQILLGTGEITNDAVQITSYTGTAPGQGRNVQVMITSSTDDTKVMNNRILTDGGTTLDLWNANPFAT